MHEVHSINRSQYLYLSCIMKIPVYVIWENKDTYQPACSCSLISVFVIHYPDSMILTFVIYIVRLLLDSVADLASLSLTWSQSYLVSQFRKQPGPVACSDVRPPGMQTVTGSILGYGNICFYVEIGRDIISTAILSPFSPYHWFK